MVVIGRSKTGNKSARLEDVVDPSTGIKRIEASDEEEPCIKARKDKMAVRHSLRSVAGRVKPNYARSFATSPLNASLEESDPQL